MLSLTHKKTDRSQLRQDFDFFRFSKILDTEVKHNSHKRISQAKIDKKFLYLPKELGMIQPPFSRYKFLDSHLFHLHFDLFHLHYTNRGEGCIAYLGQLCSEHDGRGRRAWSHFQTLQHNGGIPAPLFYFTSPDCGT